MARISRVRGEAALTIAHGDLEATFLPDVGFLGVSLRHHGKEVLALPGGVTGYKGGHVTGLPLLAPWANRLAAWRYSIAGVDVNLEGVALHDDGKGLPIHGTMTAQPGWEVERVDGAAAHARFAYGDRPDLLRAFPFPHDLELGFRLDDGSLHVATTLRPTGDRSVPVSFGWHPYFRLPASRASTSVVFPACDHVVLDERGLPTEVTQPQPPGGEPLADRAYDDLYALGDDRTLALRTSASRGGGRSVTVEFDDGYTHAQVYSPAGARFAALEPMTAPTNALVTGDCRVVEPGGRFTARFAVNPGR